MKTTKRVSKPPVALKDGKAYSFDWCAMSGTNTHAETGLYCEKSGFMLTTGGTVELGLCTNIKLLG